MLIAELRGNWNHTMYKKRSSSFEEIVEKNFLPLHLDHLTPRMIQIAKEELNENEDTRLSAIEELRKLINKEENFKCRMDDEFLLQFLRARKFNVENAFTRLQNFYKVTSITFADVFLKIEDDKAKATFGSGYASLLPQRDREGAAVVFLKIRNWKTEEMDFHSIFNCALANSLLAVEYPASQVCGVHILVDAKEITLQHVMYFTPKFINLMSKFFQDTLPIRWKSLHIVNNSAIFQCFFDLFSVFIKDKMRKRIHFHGADMDALHKAIPKEILPAEYGGDITDFDPMESASSELRKFESKYFQILRDGYMQN